MRNFLMILSLVLLAGGIAGYFLQFDVGVDMGDYGWFIVAGAGVVCGFLAQNVPR